MNNRCMSFVIQPQCVFSGLFILKPEFKCFSVPACFPVLDHQEAEDPKEACSRKTGPEQRCIVIPCSGALPSPRPDMEDRVDGSILEVHQKGVVSLGECLQVMGFEMELKAALLIGIIV